MQSVTGMDNSYWDRFWSDPTLIPLDYFTLVTFQDVRDLRDKASGNLTALCFKVSHETMSLSLSPPTHPHTPPHTYMYMYIQPHNFIRKALDMMF
jgi:hypothetical protein